MLDLPPTIRVRSMRKACAAPGQPRCGTTSLVAAILRTSTRPWPLSVVSALARSGGGPPDWGKIAKRCGDVVAQLWLVVFDREQIVAVAVTDMLADLALRKD